MKFSTIPRLRSRGMTLSQLRHVRAEPAGWGSLGRGTSRDFDNVMSCEISYEITRDFVSQSRHGKRCPNRHRRKRPRRPLHPKKFHWRTPGTHSTCGRQRETSNLGSPDSRSPDPCDVRGSHVTSGARIEVAARGGGRARVAEGGCGGARAVTVACSPSRWRARRYGDVLAAPLGGVATDETGPTLNPR